MSTPIDYNKTLDLIERMKLAKVGEYKKWEVLIKKINKGIDFNPDEIAYVSRLTRVYKDGQTTSRTKIYHTKLSPEDSKPPCKSCGEESLFYCNMNDAYFCPVHVVGHDENEI